MSNQSKFIPVWVSLNLLVLMTAGLCFWTGIASLLPTIPLYIRDIGGTQQQVGFVMGAFAIGLILARPTLGARADSHSRKQVLLIGLIVGGLAPLGYLLAHSIPLLFALRAFHGISIAAFTTAYTAYVIDQVEPERRTEILGYTSLVTPVGIGVGPVLGGLLQSHYGYEVLFIASSLLAWVGFCCIFGLEETQKTQPNSHIKTKGESWLRSLSNSGQLFLEPRLRVLSLIMFAAGSIFGTLSTFMPLYVRELNLDFNPGYYYLFAAVASFTMRLMTGRIAQRFGKGRFITLSIVCYFLSMLLLWQGTTAKAFVLSGLIEGCAGGLLIPVISAIVADRSAADERGRVFSVCLGGFDVGIALAGPIFGTFIQYIGLQNVFLSASLVSIAALALFIGYGNQSHQRSVRFALGREPDYYAFPLTKSAP